MILPAINLTLQLHETFPWRLLSHCAASTIFNAIERAQDLSELAQGRDQSAFEVRLVGVGEPG